MWLTKVFERIVEIYYEYYYASWMKHFEISLIFRKFTFL